MKAHTHPQLPINQNTIATVLLLFIFTLIGSLEAKSQQTQLHLSNKSDCTFAVEIVTCGGATTSGYCGLLSAVTINVGAPIDYFKVYYNGNTSSPDIVIHLNSCNPGPDDIFNLCDVYGHGPSGIPSQYNFWNF